MHQRVRERLPELQDLAHAADDRRQHLTALHGVALDSPAGDTFDHAGHSYRRVEKLGRNEPPTGAVRRSRHPVMIIEDTATGAKVDLNRGEDEAFWCRAVIETLRHTGVRVEELTVITQLGLINYRTPDTGDTFRCCKSCRRGAIKNEFCSSALNWPVCSRRSSPGTVPTTAEQFPGLAASTATNARRARPSRICSNDVAPTATT